MSHCNSGLDIQKSPKLEKLFKDDPSGEYPQFSSSLPSTQSNVPTIYDWFKNKNQDYHEFGFFFQKWPTFHEILLLCELRT